MELIHAPALKHRLANGPLPFAEVVRIAAQLVDALRHSLQFDIVPGDVKPDNILQFESGAVKLSDFGFAHRLSKLQPGKGLIGTPNYLSPEAAAQKPVDFRIDMYSLGVTLFELTFGRQPYSYATTSVEERLQARQFQPVQFLKEWSETVPSAWRAVPGRLLAKKPENSYTSYDEPLRASDLTRLLKLPAAGLFQRGMAWFLDTAILDAYGAFFADAEKLFLTQSAWGNRTFRPPVSPEPSLRRRRPCRADLCHPLLLQAGDDAGKNCSNCESSIRTTNPLFRPALPCES